MAGEGTAPLQEGPPSRVPVAVRETFKTILKMNHGVCLLDDLLREYEVRIYIKLCIVDSVMLSDYLTRKQTWQ